MPGGQDMQCLHSSGERWVRLYLPLKWVAEGRIMEIGHGRV